MNLTPFWAVAQTYFRGLITIVLTLLLTQMASGVSIAKIDWAIIGNGALVSFLPVIINALNPDYKKYGRKLNK